MGKTGEQLVVVLMGIIGLATVAVLVSKSADTTHVLTTAWSGFAGALSAATAPVTGGVGSPF